MVLTGKVWEDKIRELDRQLQATQKVNENLSQMVRKLSEGLRKKEDSVAELEHDMADAHLQLLRCKQELEDKAEEKRVLEVELQEMVDLNEELEHEAQVADAKLPKSLQSQYERDINEARMEAKTAEEESEMLRRRLGSQLAGRLIVVTLVWSPNNHFTPLFDSQLLCQAKDLMHG